MSVKSVERAEGPFGIYFADSSTLVPDSGFWESFREAENAAARLGKTYRAGPLYVYPRSKYRVIFDDLTVDQVEVLKTLMSQRGAMRSVGFSVVES